MNKRKLSFKWFGSLSNSNTRHSSDKTDSRHDGKRNSDTPVGCYSVDDMESRLHSPCYVRSTDMYSHVGTVPRKEKRSTRKKKGASKADTIVGQSQSLAGDYVRESPLLTALSATSLPCLDRLQPTPVHSRPLPIPPSPVHERPLPLPLAPTSPTHSPFKNSNRSPTEGARITSANTLWSQEASSLRYADPSSVVDKPSEMAAVNIVLPHTSSLAPQSALVSASRTQDLYMVMDPVASQVARGSAEDTTEKHQHLMRTQETSKPPEDSQEVELETLDGQHDAMDSSGEYVKFSKEKFWLESPTENLRKELEEELKLNSCNLRSHGWYYGRIPWEVSESLVVNHGDFIIRDSLSSQGDYVLTSHWSRHTLHFLISKSVVQSSETYTRVQYKLEGEAFDSLPSLVNFYVGSRAALTQKSQAQIHGPVNRTLPLRYLETAFSLAGSKGGVVSSPSCQRGPKLRSGNGAPSVCPWSPSTFHHREAANNSSLNSEQSLLQSPSGEVPLSTQHNTSHQSKGSCNSCTEGVVASSTLSRGPRGAQPRSSPDIALHRQCNDKLHNSLNQELLPADIDGNSYTELCPSPPPQSYVERLCAEEGSDRLRVENGNVYFSPVVETISAFRPSRYQSQLMSKENKPLEVCILRRVKELLVEIDPRTAARHITKADCMVARILDVSADVQRSMGVSSGMELLTLPHGRQLRLDLLERFHTMSIMLAVDVLGCTGTTEERASLLHKTIQIAAELKTTLGNMFGFAAIMRALELPQVSRLEQTWTVLRQRHTEGAILYEKTLKPFMKSLNDGKESCPLSNTSFPHVVPLLTLLEKSAAVGAEAEPWETVEASVDVVMCHLGAARTIAQLGGIYHSNAQTKLHDVHERPEVLELFLTEFQMRLLWGSRGAEENQAQRYAKFDQVLTALSNKLEPPIRPARPF